MRVTVDKAGKNVGVGEINERCALRDWLARILYGLDALAFDDEDNVIAVRPRARVEEVSDPNGGGGRFRWLLSEAGQSKRSTGEKGEKTIQSVAPATNR